MAINRPTTKTIISTTGWGIPITDEVNALRAAVTALQTIPPWLAVTFTNGWTATPVVGFGYRKVGDMVQFKGGINPGTIGAVAFTLPAGYRPTSDLVIGFPSTGGGNTPGHAAMQTSGAFTMWSGATSGQVAFNGIQFTTT